MEDTAKEKYHCIIPLSRTYGSLYFSELVTLTRGPIEPLNFDFCNLSFRRFIHGSNSLRLLGGNSLSRRSSEVLF